MDNVKKLTKVLLLFTILFSFYTPAANACGYLSLSYYHDANGIPNLLMNGDGDPGPCLFYTNMLEYSWSTTPLQLQATDWDSKVWGWPSSMHTSINYFPGSGSYLQMQHCVYVFIYNQSIDDILNYQTPTQGGCFYPSNYL